MTSWTLRLLNPLKQTILSRQSIGGADTLQLYFELAGGIGDDILGLEHLSSTPPAEGIFIWWEEDGNHILVTTADMRCYD